tara:strand:+ start:422 stop:601 length:180 start_codon:yes stop_codon:yes gene_type:complete
VLILVGGEDLFLLDNQEIIEVVIEVIEELQEEEGEDGEEDVEGKEIDSHLDREDHGETL